MPEISSVKRQKPTAAGIDLGDSESLNMVFDAERVTPRWMAETMAQLEQQDMLAVPKALAAVLLSWDLTDDGQPYPPTVANLSDFSFPVIQSLYEAICTAAAPSSAEGNGSPASSDGPSSDSGSMLARSPNGSDISISPPSSESVPVT